MKPSAANPSRFSYRAESAQLEYRLFLLSRFFLQSLSQYNWENKDKHRQMSNFPRESFHVLCLHSFRYCLKKPNNPEIKLEDFIKSCTSGISNHERQDSHLPTIEFNYLCDRYF